MLNIFQREQKGITLDYIYVVVIYIAKMSFSVFIVKKCVPSFLAIVKWHEIEKVVYRIKEFWKCLTCII